MSAREWQDAVTAAYVAEWGPGAQIDLARVDLDDWRGGDPHEVAIAIRDSLGRRRVS